MNLPHGFRGDGLCLVSEQDILGERQNRKSAKKLLPKTLLPMFRPCRSANWSYTLNTVSAGFWDWKHYRGRCAA